MKTLGLPEALERGLTWQRRSGAAIAHIVASTRDDDAGLKLVVSGTGEVAGWFPLAFQAAALDAARQSLARRRSRMYSLVPNDVGGEIVGVQGGEVDVFIEVLPPIRSLVIVGAGHIAHPLASMGALLGFAVTVIDDRPEFANRERFPNAEKVMVSEFAEGLASIPITADTFVVLVTRGHVHDLACLRYVLGTSAGYIGMIGSKMRIRTVFDNLKAEGVAEKDISRVFAPVGIDIGAHTPAEIAVAIAAEIVDVYRGGKAPHLTLREDVRG